MDQLFNPLSRYFPPTIHPMVVHFPIAIGFVLFLVEIIAFFSKDPFWERMGFILLTLEIFALGAAVVAGYISAHSVMAKGQTAAMLEAHKHDGILTGFIFTLLWVIRSGILRPRSRRPKDPKSRTAFALKRPRPTLFVLGLYAAGIAMIIITGSLGGDMVYKHGVGVESTQSGLGKTTSKGSAGSPGGTSSSSSGSQGSTSGQGSSQSGSGSNSSTGSSSSSSGSTGSTGSPGSTGSSGSSGSTPSSGSSGSSTSSTGSAGSSGSTSSGSSGSSNAAAVAAGQALWNSSCSQCHGSPPPFSAAAVQQAGSAAVATFIAERMPPQSPVTLQQASEIVQYLEAQ